MGASRWFLRRERDWSLSHRRLGSGAAVGDFGTMRLFQRKRQPFQGAVSCNHRTLRCVVAFVSVAGNAPCPIHRRGEGPSRAPVV